MKLSVMTTKDLRAKKPAEITAYITDLKQKQTELVHQISLQKESKTHLLGVIKRAVAQAKTIQSELDRKEQ